MINHPLLSLLWWVRASVAGTLLLMITGASDAAPPEVDFLYPEAPGVIFTNAEGHADGPFYHYMAEVFEKANVPFHASEYPFSRLMTVLKTHPNSFSQVDDPAALEECCLLSKEPTYVGDVAAYHLSELPAIAKKEELAGRSVITMLGHTFGPLTSYLDSGTNQTAHETTPDHDSAFRMLRLRRADYFVAYSINAAAYLADHPMADLSCENFERTRLYFALSKSYPDAEKVMARLEAISKSMPKIKTLGIPCK